MPGPGFVPVSILTCLDKPRATMETTPHDTEVDAGSPGTGILPRNSVAEAGPAWMRNVEWGPNHMLNDMGPATVASAAEDTEREATDLTIQRAVERAIEKGEEYEYDE